MGSYEVDKPSGESPFSVEGCFLRVDLEKLGEAGLSTHLVLRLMEQLVAPLKPEASPVDGILISEFGWHQLVTLRAVKALKLFLARTVLFSGMDRKAMASQLEGHELRLEKWMFNLVDSSQQRYQVLSGLLADFPNLKSVMVKGGEEEVILSREEIAARAIPGAELPLDDPLEVKPVTLRIGGTEEVRRLIEAEDKSVVQRSGDADEVVVSDAEIKVLFPRLSEGLSRRPDMKAKGNAINLSDISLAGFERYRDMVLLDASPPDDWNQLMEIANLAQMEGQTKVLDACRDHGVKRLGHFNVETEADRDALLELRQGLEGSPLVAGVDRYLSHSLSELIRRNPNASEVDEALAWMRSIAADTSMEIHLDLSNSKVTDATLEKLHSLPIVGLNVTKTRITGSGFASVDKSCLKSVNAGGCEWLTDAGLGNLSGAPLESLDVSGTWIEGLGFSFLDKSRLKSVNAGGCERLTDDGLRGLSSAPLESLDVSKARITGSGFASLDKRNLKKVDARRCRQLTDVGLAELSGAPLESLDVGGTRITGSGFASVDKSRLKSVNVRGCKWFTDEHLRGLSRAPLKSLNVSYSLITGSGFAFLNKSGLTSVDADECRQLTDDGLRGLSGAPLESLTVEHTLITGSSFASLDKSRLKSVDASRCLQLTDDGLRGLSGAPLESLGVGVTGITGSGFAALDKSRLKGVYAFHCKQLTDAGLAQLSGAPLESLDVGATKITGSGFASLDKSRLKSVYAWRCKRLTDDGLRGLSDAPLEFLDVSRTGIEGLGFASLDKTNLKKVDVGWCKRLTDEGLSELSGAPLESLSVFETGITGTGFAALDTSHLKSVDARLCDQLTDADRQLLRDAGVIFKF